MSWKDDIRKWQETGVERSHQKRMDERRDQNAYNADGATIIRKLDKIIELLSVLKDRRQPR